MQIEDLATKKDLEAIKQEILQALQALTSNNQVQGKEYLRSKEVRQLLGISSGSLQNLRVKSLLHPIKISGVYYYKLSEIKALLSGGKE